MPPGEGTGGSSGSKGSDKGSAKPVNLNVAYS
jgi:hypothetical protein